LRATGDLIVGYAYAAILAPRPSLGGEFHGASGVFVELRGRYFFVTANHVVSHDFDAIRLREPNLVMHLGDAQFVPASRVIYADPDADVAFLEVTQAEAEAVGRWIYRPLLWPPEPPRVGDLMGIAGYPACIRMREGTRRVEFRGFATQTPLTSINDRQMLCAFNRAEWVELGVPGGLDEHDLGGISGGPVFVLGGIQPRLVGIVAEHGPDLDALYGGRLDRATPTLLGLPDI